MALITEATFDSLRETLGLSRKSGITESHTRSYRDPNVIQIPGKFFPHADFDDALWIKIKAKKISNQKTGGRGGTLQIAQHGPTWKFLAPEELVEVHNHDWEEYESFHSKILEKIRALHVGADQFSQIFTQGADELKKLWNAGYTKDVLSRVEDAIKRTTVTTVPEAKVDTPLVYKNSGRRTYELNFILADPEGADLVSAIKLLQKYAAPDNVDEFRIDFPWIFEITTEPSELIRVSYAALKSVQPTYQAPYINGNPIRAELALSFEDMSPLFKKTIEEGTIIHVDESEAERRLELQTSQTQRDTVRAEQVGTLLRNY